MLTTIVDYKRGLSGMDERILMARTFPLLTRGEAAQRLHVSMSTVRRLGAAGLITEVQVGRRAVRIDAASVDAHIRASRRPARQAA